MAPVVVAAVPVTLESRLVAVVSIRSLNVGLVVSAVEMASTTTRRTDAEPYPVVLTVVSGMEMEYAWWIPDTA
jgi:uncharacterized membrane protein (UPF0136 family)